MRSTSYMKTILVIDDDDRIKTLCEKRLGKFGYNVIVADGESDILQILELNGIDLVLLDQIMPGKDGLEVMEMIKHGSHLPVIMMTAFGSIDLAITFMQSGGVDFVEKPIDFDILNIKIQKEILAAERLKKEILDRKHAERQLLQAQKMEALGRLAGGISHDFGNILSVIMGNAIMALEHLPSGHPAVVHLSQIDISGKHATTLIKQILAFNYQKNDQAQSIQIQPIIDEVFTYVKATLPSNVKINRNICASANKVLAIESKIHQVILNLCTNAIEAIENDYGTITMNCRVVSATDIDHAIISDITSKKYVELAIKDTGKGIDVATLEHIFEPYFTTKKQAGGTGWGLFIIHEIIRECGGAVNVESQPGKGSTFRVYIPCINQPRKRENQTCRYPKLEMENTFF